MENLDRSTLDIPDSKSPWRIIPHETQPDVFEICAGEGYVRVTVATVYGKYNANVIMMTPVLLEACQKALSTGALEHANAVFLIKDLLERVNNGMKNENR